VAIESPTAARLSVGGRGSASWQRLEDRLRGVWTEGRTRLAGGRRLPPGELLQVAAWSDRDYKLAFACLGKTLALIWESAFACRLWARHATFTVEIANGAAGCGLLVALSLLLVVMVGFLARLWRRRSQPAGLSLASWSVAVTMAAACGMAIGVCVEHGDYEAMDSILLVYLFCGLLFEVGRGVLPVMVNVPVRNPFGAKVSGGLTIFYALLAITVVAPYVDRNNLPALVVILALLQVTPLTYVLVAGLTTPLLSGPYKPKQALLGRVARGDRLRLAVQAWTALLPLGGLAVPLWVRWQRLRPGRVRRWLAWRGV